MATTGLAPAEATRVIDDVLAFHHEPVEAYVRRRHGELKLRGAKNDDIFTTCATSWPTAWSPRPTSPSASCAG